MRTFSSISNGESGLSVRGKLNNALTSIISGSEGINAIWAKIESVIQMVNATESGIGGLVKDTSYDPASLGQYRSAVLIALCTGTFNKIKDKNGTPITIPGNNAITIFYRAEDTTYWEYATQEIFPAVDSYESNDSSKIENAKTHVMTHNGNAIKPMTDFDSVFDADGKSLSDKLTELDSNISLYSKNAAITDIIKIGDMEFTPTTHSGFIKNDGSIFDNVDTWYYTSPFLLKKGQTLIFIESVNSIISALCSCDSSGDNRVVILAGKTASETKICGYYKAETDIYLRLSYSAEHDAYFYIRNEEPSSVYLDKYEYNSRYQFATIIKNSFIKASDGVRMDNFPGYSSTEYIDISRNKTGYIKVQPSYSVNTGAFYYGDDSYAGGIGASDSGVYQIPANAKKVRLTIENIYLEQLFMADCLANGDNIQTQLNELARSVIMANPRNIDSVSTLNTLNAHIYVDENGILFLCNYNNNTVSKYSLINKKEPIFIGSIKTGNAPRDCLKIDKYLFVACMDGNSISVYDISDIEETVNTDTPVYSISVTNPKKMIYVDGYLYVVGVNFITKYSIDFTNGVSMTMVADITTDGMMLCVAYNGYGLFCACGLVNKLYFFDKNLNYHTVNAGQYAWCEFHSGMLFLSTKAGGIDILKHNADNTVSTVGAILVGDNFPEEFIIVDDTLYTVSLSDEGEPSYLFSIDITDPSYLKINNIIKLVGEGAGFIGKYRDYLYIDFHWTGILQIVKIGV